MTRPGIARFHAIGFAVLMTAQPAMAESVRGTPQDTAGAGSDPTGQWFAFGNEEGRLLTTVDAQGRGLLFLCKDGSGQVMLTHDLITPDQTTVTLVAGDQRVTHAVVSEGPGGDVGERRYMLATLSVDAPVVQAFRQQGRLEVIVAGRSLPAVVGPEMKPTVEAYFTQCARR